MKELTTTPQNAVERLSAAGFKIGKEKLCAALVQGKLPFGFAISMEGGRHEYVLFSKDLDDFIQEHGG